MIVGVELIYNVNYWKFGVEYIYIFVVYGLLYFKNGKIIDIYFVGNNCIVGVVMFMF